MSQELQKKSVSAEELAKLIDAVGECNWQRFRRHSGDNNYDVKLMLGGGTVLAFISFSLCLGPGPIVALIVLAVALAYPFYVWQNCIMLRGDLEDAMLLADEDEIAKAISMAKWEYVGFDSAERVKSRGRPELESFEVLRTFEPEDVKKAHQAMKNPVVAKELKRVREIQNRIESRFLVWGVLSGIFTGVSEYLLITNYWPTLFAGDLSYTNKKLLFALPILVGTGVYYIGLAFCETERDQLAGLSKAKLKKIKRRAKNTGMEKTSKELETSKRSTPRRE